jgi:hypothetical protein
MESGFGQNLEGFLIKGNLSLSPAELPYLQGDGSAEVAGTLYTNNIMEYDYNNGINIQNIIIKKNEQIYIPYTQPSSNLTTASFILDGGITIKNTTNSANISSGGALTIAGGMSISKNVNIGGQLNVNNNRILNVLTPIVGTDAVNKDYVDLVASKLSGNFTSGQVIIGENNGTAIRGYDSFTFNGSNLNIKTPVYIQNTSPSSSISTGALIIDGGVSIGGKTFMNNDLDLGMHGIRNVKEPTNNTDVATKYYVDSKTFGSLLGSFQNQQVLIGTTDPGTVKGYSNFLYDGTTLSIGSTSGRLVIHNSSDTLSTSIPTSIVTYGGASIYKNLYVDGDIFLNDSKISGVALPTSPYDAANKKYVDDLIASNTNGGGIIVSGGNVSGVFTSGQLIIAQSTGSSVRGYDNLFFDISNGTIGTLNANKNTSLVLQSTTNASGLNSGGVLTVNGGASFGKNVYIGGELDVNIQNIKNVKTPYDPLDAVNKEYVDTIVSQSCDCCALEDNLEYPLDLQNNVLSPELIPTLTFKNSDVLAFITYIYVQHDNASCALYTIRGINRNSNWYISKTFIGEKGNVDFFIINNPDEDQGEIHYINTNSSGKTSIRFRTASQVSFNPSSTQLNIPLIQTSSHNFLNVPGLTFDSSNVDSNKILIHITSPTDNKHGLYFINCVKKGSEWELNNHNIGNITNIRFRVISENGYGKVQYTNTNVTNDYFIRAQQLKIFHSQSAITLNANTFVPENVDNIRFKFDNTKTNFRITVYVDITPLNKYALYELEGLYCDNNWKLNSRYIGDPTGIHFSLTTTGDNTGYLQYTNINTENGIVRFINNTPSLFPPLPVNRGGTGANFHNPHAVLRGNGYDSIIGSPDFVYENYQLRLGNASSILLTNTSNVSSLTSQSTLTSYGGVSIYRNLFVGEQLYVNDINISPSVGDITAEQTFYAINNQSTPAPVLGFSFTHLNVKSFVATACVTITTSSESFDALYDIKGLKKSSGWIIQSSYFGDDLGFTFSITNSGLIHYTSANTDSWISTVVKFRATTTST